MKISFPGYALSAAVLSAFLCQFCAASSMETLWSSGNRLSLGSAALEQPDIAATVPPPPALGVKDVAIESISPDLTHTPGQLCTDNDENFDGYRYPERVPHCRRNVPRQMKVEVAQEYGVPQSDWPNYEFDHLIPLGIGGSSSKPNLWPQPRGSEESDGKDKLEFQLHKALSAGTITQAEAVRQTYAWFNKYIANHPELPASIRKAIKARLPKAARENPETANAQ